MITLHDAIHLARQAADTVRASPQAYGLGCLTMLLMGGGWRAVRLLFRFGALSDTARLVLRHLDTAHGVAEFSAANSGKPGNVIVAHSPGRVLEVARNLQHCTFSRGSGSPQDLREHLSRRELKKIRHRAERRLREQKSSQRAYRRVTLERSLSDEVT